MIKITNNEEKKEGKRGSFVFFFKNTPVIAVRPAPIRVYFIGSKLEVINSYNCCSKTLKEALQKTLTIFSN